MSAVILREQIIHYEVLGRGRPLVFLHGWVGSWRYWVPSMQATSQSFRAYALDLWGYGDSAKKPLFYSLEQQVSLLSEFLNEMGIGKIALIGHGLGAVVGILYSIRNPNLVDRLMAVGLPQNHGSLHPRLRSASPSELADWLLARNSISEPLWAEVAKLDPKAIAISLADLDNLNIKQLIQNLATSCLLVQGMTDPAVEATISEELTELPEQAHYILFEGSAHFPMLDETAKFNRLLADFLSLASGESPRQLQLKEEWKRRVR
jgi:pimeloyl-ACP methyl ester carboxylesterase